MSGESTTSPRRIEAAEKRRRALQLRKAGATFDQIAEQVGYDNRGNACRAIQQELADLPKEDAVELRDLELARLDSLLTAMWPKAMNGNGWAVDRVLRIMERRARLAGLDQPEQIAITTAQGDFETAYQELVAEMRAREQQATRDQP